MTDLIQYSICTIMQNAIMYFLFFFIVVFCIHSYCEIDLIVYFLQMMNHNELWKYIFRELSFIKVKYFVYLGTNIFPFHWEQNTYHLIFH